MSFIKLYRPELKRSTIKSYEREYEVLKNDYEVDDDLDLFNMIKDIALEEMNLDHVFLNTKKYQKKIRLSVIRSLIELFKDELNDKDYEMIDLMILEERFKS